jgi:general secretion pathway protein G
MPRQPAITSRSDRGFTLIELLIVIVILGVLAGIVVFAVGGITDTGDEAACKADIKTVTTAVEAFRAQTGVYPATGDAAAEAALVPLYLNSYPDTVNYSLAAGDPDVAGAAGANNDCTGITI